jgi:hypothetical protein
MKRPNEKIFALYKGEKLLADGTLKEIATRMGIKVESVRFYKTPTYQRRVRGENRRTLVWLGDDDND